MTDSPDHISSGCGFGPTVRGCVFDIKKYALHDGPGIRTTVFFKGCPLRCRWCHNPESWQSRPEPSLRQTRCVRCGRCLEICGEKAIEFVDSRFVTDPEKCVCCGECVDGCLADAREVIGREMTADDVMAEVEKDLIFYDESGGGATFSGGEPLMQPEFLLALLGRCRAVGIHTAVDTTCYADAELVSRVAEAADLFLCDIKHMNSSLHERYTGVGNDLILANIRHLAEAGANMVIRIPIIPAFNDGNGNIEATAEFIRSLQTVGRIDLLPYNGGGLEKSVRLSDSLSLMEAKAPSDETMDNIAAILRGCGFEVRIGG